MSTRKETPDLLSEILESNLPEQKLPPKPPIESSKAKPKPARKTATSSQRRKRGPQKWEYRVVSFQEYKGWRPRFVNGEELAGWMESPELIDYLGEAGNEGWELTATNSGEALYGVLDKLQLYFKRLTE